MNYSGNVDNANLWFELMLLMIYSFKITMNRWSSQITELNHLKQIYILHESANCELIVSYCKIIVQL